MELTKEEVEARLKALDVARRMLMDFSEATEKALHGDDEATDTLRSLSRETLAFLTGTRQEPEEDEEAGEEQLHLCASCAHCLVCVMTHAIPHEFGITVSTCVGYAQLEADDATEQ